MSKKKKLSKKVYAVIISALLVVFVVNIVVQYRLHQRANNAAELSEITNKLESSLLRGKKENNDTSSSVSVVARPAIPQAVEPQGEPSGRHQLPGTNFTSTTKCSCGGWQEKWYYKGDSTPACCLRQTAETVFNLVDFFELHNITYSPVGGGLVGIIRCGSLTSYEYDFDLRIYSMPSQDTLKPLMQKWIKEQKQPGGILAKWGVTVGGLKFIQNGWGDFNKRTSRGDVHLDFEVVNEEIPSPVRPCSFYGRTLTCRGDADEYLTKRYGKDWMTPRRWCSWKHLRLCDTHDEKEHGSCQKARQEMRDGPGFCGKYPDLLVGTVGCNGSDAEEVLPENNKTTGEM